MVSELWARVLAQLQQDERATIVTDAATGVSLTASDVLAEVSVKFVVDDQMHAARACAKLRQCSGDHTGR